MKHWKVFEDHEQLIFLQTLDEFFRLHVDEENNSEINSNEGNLDLNFKQEIVDQDIIQLLNNYTPKGLVPLDFFLIKMMC